MSQWFQGSQLSPVTAPSPDFPGAGDPVCDRPGGPADDHRCHFHLPWGSQRWWAESCKDGYGSIPINTIFRGMNIHLPAILMFTRGIGFWPIPPCPYDNELIWNDMPVGGLKHSLLSIIYGIILPIDWYVSRWLKPPTSMKWWYNCNILQ